LDFPEISSHEEWTYAAEAGNRQENQQKSKKKPALMPASE